VKGVFNGLNFDRGGRGKTLRDAQKLNEKSLHRCVGLSVETRPDYVDKKALVNFRKLGCTKVEVGVQCLDDKIYKLNNRGHGVKEVRNALKLLKDAGFKINVHFMPNMYGSTPKKDLEMFKMLFSDPDFRPDWLKIYPCVVVPYSPLEKIYKAGKHKPYSDKELINLLIELKKIVPEYCRITRLYRDIPAESIIGGTRISNLRQYVQAEMVERGEKCRCIRCREIKGDDFDPKNVKLIVREYDSSSGKEYFLSFEDIKNDKIVGYLRLRIPSCYKNHWIGELTNSTIIRELHVFGEHVKVNNRLEKAGQHKGYGKKLIEKAVELTKSYNIPRLAVISGVGVRDYYRKLGFKDGGLYQFLKIK
jgi:elongator complex protein 3